MTTPPSLPVAYLTDDLTVLPTLADAYDANAAALERARAAAADLLPCDVSTLTPEEDERLATYLVRARRTLEQLRARREPLTQAFDAVRQRFVQLEAELDPKKAGSLTARLQALRDAYAARLREEARLRREAEEARLAALEAEQRSLQVELATATGTDRAALEAARFRNELAHAQQAAAVAAPAAPEPAGRLALRATVTHPRAYVALLALYVERETPTLEALAKLPLARLETWAAQLATTTGEVLEVEGLTYVETFRTVAH